MMKALLYLRGGVYVEWAIDIDTVRQQFEQAKSSKEATESLYKSLSTYTKDDPLLLAYKGASLTLKARFLADRGDKKKMVAEGIKTIETAVVASPKQVEIRLVRLAVQENSPKILKYKMNMAEDKQMILTNFAGQPKAVQSLIKRYAQQSAVFTDAERKQLGG